MRYSVTHSTTYTYTETVSTCQHQVHLAPRSTAFQQCENHRVVVHPVPSDRDKRLDYFGNGVDYFSILDPHRKLTITSSSRVTVEPPAPPKLDASPTWEAVADLLRTERSPKILEACQFVYGSPRVTLAADEFEKQENGNGQPNVVDAIRSYALESFKPKTPIAQAAFDLTRRIHADFAFDAKATTLSTPFDVAFTQRRGVCQDFAHIQIACLRSLGLASRYVSGYLRTVPPPGKPRLVGADVSHAWISVFCGELGWIDYDPTNQVIPGESHITVAWGRDYDDVCPVQGVFLGGGQHTMTTSVDVAVA